MKFWFETTTALVMVAVAVWQWAQIRRHPSDAALRIMAAGVTTIAVVLISSIELPPIEYVHDLLHEITFTTIAWVFLFYCYSVFFLLAKASSGDLERRSVTRRALLEFGVYVVLIACLMVVSFTVDRSFWRNQTPEEVRSFRNVAYYLLVDGYPIILWTLGTVRAVGYLCLLGHRWARLATLGVVIGMGMMAAGVDAVTLVGVGARIVDSPEAQIPWLRALYNPLRLGGQVLLALALASAPLATLVIRLRERRALGRGQARDLELLWRMLVDEFPQLRLPTSDPDDRPPPVDRMMIEISDGLAYLAPWATDDRTSAVHVQISDALAAKRTATTRSWSEVPPFVSSGDLPQWEPDFDRQDRRRARWMAELARELRRNDNVATQTTAAPGDAR